MKNRMAQLEFEKRFKAYAASLCNELRIAPKLLKRFCFASF
jgi:hypothetical protein